MWNEPVSSAEGKLARPIVCNMEVGALIVIPSHTFTYSGAVSVPTFCYSLFGGTYCETPTGQISVPVSFITQTSAK